MSAILKSAIRERYKSAFDERLASTWAKKNGFPVVVRSATHRFDNDEIFGACWTKSGWAFHVSPYQRRDIKKADVLVGYSLLKSWRSSKTEPHITLPNIRSEHLHTNFGGSSEYSGAGADDAVLARELWNCEKYVESFPYLVAAISKGLDPAAEAAARNCIGQIYVQEGELVSAISEYLRVLVAPIRGWTTASHAALSLAVVYKYADNRIFESDSDKLRQFADPRLKLEGYVESHLRGFAEGDAAGLRAGITFKVADTGSPIVIHSGENWRQLRKQFLSPWG